MDISMSDCEKRLRQIHQLATKDDFTENVQEFYQNWAEDYDNHHDHIKAIANKNTQYSGPAFAAEALSKVLPDKNALIVDCAAGTGRVGEELFKCGFSSIDAVDFSQKCLDISASKGVYRRLICDAFGRNRKLNDVTEGYYSGLTCVGGISIGHLSDDVFPEWTRIVKKGGFMVFTLSWLVFPDDPKEHTDTMIKIRDAINQLTKDGVWEIVDKVELDGSFILGYGAELYTICRL